MENAWDYIPGYRALDDDGRIIPVPFGKESKINETAVDEKIVDVFGEEKR